MKTNSIPGMIHIFSFCNKIFYTRPNSKDGRTTYIYSCFKLRDGNPSIIAQHLPTNIFTDWSRTCLKRKKAKHWTTDQSYENRTYIFILTIKLQQHVCFQKVFGSCNFTFSDTCTESYPKNQLEKSKCQVVRVYVL